jgi:RNA-directed DNA polymerase
VNQQFSQLKVEQAPDKTFIGYIAKGFDFLGYHFSRKSMVIANITIESMLIKYERLYEQTKKTPQGAAICAEHLKRWLRWTQAGPPPEIQRLAFSAPRGCYTEDTKR